MYAMYPRRCKVCDYIHRMKEGTEKTLNYLQHKGFAFLSSVSNFELSHVSNYGVKLFFFFFNLQVQTSGGQATSFRLLQILKEIKTRLIYITWE